MIGRTNDKCTSVDQFNYPILSEQKLNNGCHLLWDTWVDTSCLVIHDYVGGGSLARRSQQNKI